MSAVSSLWRVYGFAFESDPKNNATIEALKANYPHSGRKKGSRARVQGNVAIIFRYTYFFRKFVSNEFDIVRNAGEDLAMNPYECERIFHRYARARQDYIKKAGRDHIPDDAPPSDRILCDAVDKTISLQPGNLQMTAEQRKNEIHVLRSYWKITMDTWQQQSSKEEPYLPKGDKLLLELLENAESALSGAMANQEEVGNNPQQGHEEAAGNEEDLLVLQRQDIDMEGEPVLITDDDNDNNKPMDDMEAQYRFLFEWLITTRDLALTDPLKAMEHLEAAILDPTVPEDLKKLCWDLGRVTQAKIDAEYAKMMAEQAQAMAIQDFTTVANRVAQLLWGPRQEEWRESD